MVKSKAKETVYAVTFVVGIFIIVSIFFVDSLQSGTPVGTTIQVINCPDGFTESIECIFTSIGQITSPICEEIGNPENTLHCGSQTGEPLPDGGFENIFVSCSGVKHNVCEVP